MAAPDDSPRAQTDDDVAADESIADLTATDLEIVEEEEPPQAPPPRTSGPPVPPPVLVAPRPREVDPPVSSRPHLSRPQVSRPPPAPSRSRPSAAAAPPPPPRPSVPMRRSSAPPAPMPSVPPPSAPPPPLQPPAPYVPTTSGSPTEQAEALIRLCKSELAQGPEALRAARLHYEIARLLEGLLQDPGAAGDHYQKAAKLMPEHRPSLQGARRALAQSRRYKEAVALFDAEIRVTRDTRERALLFLEKGELLEDATADLEGALEAYRSALELAPEDRSVLKAIERCERRSENWSGLSQAFERLSRVSERDPAYRAALVGQRALLAEYQQNDPAQAAQLHGAALSIDPSAPMSRASFKRLAWNGGDWSALLSALGSEQAKAESPRARADLLERIARIQQHRFGDVGASIAVLEEALALVPEDLGLRRRLTDLYRLAGDHEKHTALLSSLAELETHPRERLALHLRIAQLYENEVGDPVRARAWYEHTLGLDPANRAALEALGRLYEQSGEWDATVAMYQREAAATEDVTRKAAVHARIAELLEHRLGRPEDAATEHARVLGWRPDHEASFKALLRLYSGQHRWRDLVELLQRAVDRAPSDERAVGFLFRIGRILEDRLDDAAGAAHAYGRILSLEPTRLDALHALQRAAQRAERYQELVEALDREAKLTDDRSRGIEIDFFVGEILDEHLDDSEAAVRRLQRVLELDPTHLPALGALGRLYTRAGRFEDLLDNRKALLHGTENAADQVDLLYEMGELCRHKLGREGDAIGHYRRALEIDPEHEPSFATVVQVLTDRGNYSDLTDLLETRIGTRSDPLENARLAVELGELFEEHLQKPGRALEWYEQALRAVPTYRPALDARGRLLAQEGSFEQLADALASEARTTGLDAVFVDAKMREGEVRGSRLGDLSAAADCYTSVLERSPGHLGALLALEDIHFRRRDREKLADIYDRQAGAFVDEGSRVAALREVARLAKWTGDGERERAAYRRMLEIRPDDPDALQALARADDPEQRSEREQLGLHSRLASRALDPSLVAYHQTCLAELMEGSGSPEALEAYRSALALDPESLSAARGFTRVAQKGDDPATLREAAQLEARVTRDVPLAVHLYLSSAAAWQGQGHATAAVEDLEAALELEPESTDAARRLSETLCAAGEVARLVDLLGRAADRARREDRQAELHREVARLHLDYAQNVPAAIAALQRALKAAPSSGPALDQLSACLIQMERWNEAADALRRLVRASDDDQVLASALLRLAAIADERLGDAVEARRCLETALMHDADSREALGRLARIDAREGRPDQALELSRRLVETAQTPQEKAAALVECARIERTLHNDVDGAAALLEAVSAMGPKHEGAQRYRSMIAEGSEHANWDDYLGALMRHLDFAPRAELPIAPTYLALAEVYGDSLETPERAVETLRTAIQRLPSEPTLSLALADRMTASLQHPEVIAEMRRLLAYRIDVPDAWRRLAHALRELGETAEGLVALLPLQVLDAASPEELMTIRGRPMRTALARPGLLGDSGVRQVAVGDAFDAPSAQLVMAMADAFKKLYAFDPSRWGVSKRDRLRAGADHPLRLVVDRVVAIVGAVEVDVYEHDMPVGDATVEYGSPPALMVPSWASNLSQSELVFMITRPLVALARDLGAVMRLSVEELTLNIVAAGAAAAPGWGPAVASPDAVETRAREISKALSRRSRRPFDEAVGRLVASSPPDVGAWMQAVQQSVARAALLVADDLAGSVAITRRIAQTETLPEEAADLMRFWVSDTAVRFRRAVSAS